MIEHMRDIGASINAQSYVVFAGYEPSDIDELGAEQLGNIPAILLDPWLREYGNANA